MNNKKIIEKIDKEIKHNSIPLYYKKYKPSKKIRDEIINYKKPFDQHFCNLLNKYVKPYHHHTHIDCNFKNIDNYKGKYKISHLPKKLQEYFYTTRPPSEFYYDNKTKIGKIVFYKFFLDSKNTKDTIEKDYINHIKAIQTFLSKHKFRGLILDLRFHLGGDMWPTIYGFQSILANVPFLIFTKDDKVKKNDLYLTIDDKPFTSINKMRLKPIKMKENKINTDYPISIIIGEYTYSSGEIISAIFAGKKNVKIFGKKSGGGLSANDTIPITKNITLILTTSLVRLTNGKFKEYLIPDKITNSPITDAKKWIIKYNKHFTK